MPQFDSGAAEQISCFRLLQPNQPIVRRDFRRRDIIVRKDTIDNRNETER
jgi:hypothetical protein